MTDKLHLCENLLNSSPNRKCLVEEGKPLGCGGRGGVFQVPGCSSRPRSSRGRQGRGFLRETPVSVRATRSRRLPSPLGLFPPFREGKGGDGGFFPVFLSDELYWYTHTPPIRIHICLGADFIPNPLLTLCLKTAERNPV